MIRYNWIEGGRNSSLDLVEHVENSELYASDAYVYGNVIVKPNNSNNSRIILFGVDNAGHFRLGTCYFYNNTVIIKDTRIWGTRRVFHLNDTVANIIAENNIIYKSDAITYDLAIGSTNLLTGSNNWFSNNISGTNILANSLSGSDPGFVDYINEDYNLSATSPCLDIVSTYSFPSNYDLDKQYVKHLSWQTRPTNGNLDLGAFEYATSLPIILINFSGQFINKRIELNWSTIMQNNNRGFEIQKLNLLNQWTNLGFVNGENHIDGIINYNFTDKKPYDKSNYYRLKHIDYDGLFGYSKVIIVENDYYKGINVYPNPTFGSVNITGLEVNNIRLFDTNGELLREFKSTSTIDISKFPDGGYFLEVVSNNTKVIKKIIKNRESN
ncbi:MAG: T9SS type A sorting domain-containing protein [Saprospiraceae bacterium]